VEQLSPPFFPFFKEVQEEKNCQKYLAVKGLGKGRGRFATAIHLQPKEGGEKTAGIFLPQKIHIRTGKRVTKGTQEGCEGIVQRCAQTRTRVRIWIPFSE
jgi:hypothetical protein